MGARGRLARDEIRALPTLVLAVWRRAADRVGLDGAAQRLAAKVPYLWGSSSADDLPYLGVHRRTV